MKWYPVTMLINGEVYQDEIRGTSPGNALKNAQDNWGEYADDIRLYLESSRDIYC